MELIVKGLPSQFTRQEKTEFLNLFGAKQVTCLTKHLHHACVVKFPDALLCKQALEALHQFEVLDSRLIVEYANKSHIKFANQSEARQVLGKRSAAHLDEKLSDEPTIENETNDGNGINAKLGLSHEFPPHLCYKYPEPTVAILTNIANALASVPIFYTQVLNLMNRMCLPPPFTDITPTPKPAGDTVDMKDAQVLMESELTGKILD